MEHFVVYHNAEKMGRTLGPQGRLNFLSRKSLGLLNQGRGNTIWMIQGSRVGSRTSYSLCGAYILEFLQEVPDDPGVYILDGDQGRDFNPPILLDDLEWFPALRKNQGNFGLGFNRVTDPEIVKALLVLQASHASPSPAASLPDIDLELNGLTAAAHVKRQAPRATEYGMDEGRNSRLDRPGIYSETDYVEAIVVGLWPDASVRQEVFAFLATSIRFAAANGPNAWEVSLFENLVRINVGQIAVLDCTQERIGIYFLQPCSFSSDPAFSLDREWPGYKAISKEAGYCVCAPQAIGECPAALREAHLALIREAAARKRGSPWKASHSAEFVAHLAAVLGTDIPQPSYALLGSEDSENSENEVGQGFGDQEENRETEAAAVDLVSRQYRLDGWLVNSVELERCGYDLHCTRGREEIHVEVKGTRGNGRSVLLTAAEFDRGFSDDRFVFVIVAAACSIAPVVTYWPAKEFRQFFTFEAIQYRARSAD